MYVPFGMVVVDKHITDDFWEVGVKWAGEFAKSDHVHFAKPARRRVVSDCELIHLCSASATKRMEYTNCGAWRGYTGVGTEDYAVHCVY